MKYSIITATKNEVKYIRRTFISVVNQSILPQEWIIINDDSEDGSDEVIKDYIKRFKWIKTYKLINFHPEIKATGGRVACLLNFAISKLNQESEFICKLDSDVEFESNFFEKLLTEFEKNPKLGIASGNLVFEGKVEKLIVCSIRGADFLCRTEVLKKTKGFFESVGRGEDTLLSVAARSFGWETKSFPIYFKHLKPEGSKNSSFFESYVTGFYKGSIPYLFLYFLLTQLKHTFKKPFVLGSILQIIGYIYSRFIINYKPFPEYIHSQLILEQKQKILKIKF
jgi:glycosyltransferase involved in cell wall biosynthesis